MSFINSIRIILLGLILSSFFTVNNATQVDVPDWLSDIEQAKTTAARNNMPILVSFSGSDWCIPCIRLEKDLFSSEEFKSFADENLVLLKLDFPARKKNALSDDQLKHNEALAELYNTKGAFPLVVIIDELGDLKGTMQHPLPSPEAYINSIKAIINSI